MGFRCTRIKISFILFFLAIVRAEYGPYKIRPKEMMECEGIETAGKFRYDSNKIRKVNRTATTFSTTFYWDLPFTDHYSVTIDMSKWGNGGWRPNYFTFEMEKACTFSKDYLPEIFNALKESSNSTDCPLPAGVYKLSDFPVNEIKTAKTISTFEYGHYKIAAAVMDGVAALGCMGLVIDVVPVKKTKGK